MCRAHLKDRMGLLPLMSTLRSFSKVVHRINNQCNIRCRGLCLIQVRLMGLRMVRHMDRLTVRLWDLLMALPMDRRMDMALLNLFKWVEIFNLSDRCYFLIFKVKLLTGSRRKYTGLAMHLLLIKYFSNRHILVRLVQSTDRMFLQSASKSLRRSWVEIAQCLVRP